jgi:hypothetical protein
LPTPSVAVTRITAVRLGAITAGTVGRSAHHEQKTTVQQVSTREGAPLTNHKDNKLPAPERCEAV